MKTFLAAISNQISIHRLSLFASILSLIGFCSAGFASTSASTSASTPTSTRDAVFADQVTLACGYSDAVWDYIHEVSQSRPQIIPGPGKQGESARIVTLFADNSFITTMEFVVNPGNADLDITCIVDKGPAAEAYDSINKRITELPSAVIGRTPTAIDAILMTPARLLDI